jgi:hypothetical protein
LSKGDAMRSSKQIACGFTRVVVAALISWHSAIACALPQTDDTPPAQGPRLQIIVLKGEDGLNVIKNKTAVKPVVEVRDRNNMPVAGAYVTFFAPQSGPSVAFVRGTGVFSTFTDARGRAMVLNMKPIGTGSFKIRVTASFHGQTAGATISQTNYATLAAAQAAAHGGVGTVAAGSGAGLSGAAIAGIAVGIAAAIGVAIVASKGGGAAKTGGVPTGTIGAGTSPVVIGPPQ